MPKKIFKKISANFGKLQEIDLLKIGPDSATLNRKLFRTKSKSKTKSFIVFKLVPPYRVYLHMNSFSALFQRRFKNISWIMDICLMQTCSGHDWIYEYFSKLVFDKYLKLAVVFKTFALQDLNFVNFEICTLGNKGFVT